MNTLIAHPKNPQKRVIARAAETLAAGGVLVYPTDSHYALGCALDARAAVARIRQIRAMQENHLFTICCRNIGDIGDCAAVDDAAFRQIRAVAPGPYTFVLRATKKMRHFYHPKRRTVAFRVPGNPVAQALLAAHGAPIITATLRFGEDEPPLNTEDFPPSLAKQVDAILDGGPCPGRNTAIYDFSGGSGQEAEVLRD